MRDGYTEELLDLERRRRRHKFGRRARRTHLAWLTSFFLALACVCWLHMWWSPAPSAHVWIDDVLVEVVTEGWLNQATHFFFLGGVLCGVLLIAFSLCAGPDHGTHTSDIDRISAGGRRSAKTKDPQASVPSLSLPRRPPATGSTHGLASAATAAGVSEDWRHHRTAGARFDATRPMRTSEELTRYLDTLAQQRVRPGTAQVVGVPGATASSAQGRQGSLYMPAATRTWSPPGTGYADMYQGTVRVLYEAGGSDAVRAAQTGLDWSSLRITQPELCLRRMREWVRDVCQTFVKEIDDCDNWFHANDVWAFDCSNPLSETVPNAAPAAPLSSSGLGGSSMGMGGFGASAASPYATAAQMAPVTKQMLLMREKEHMRSHQRSGVHFSTSLRYDQRLALEARLDVAATFVPDQDLTVVARRQVRAYVLARLRTLATQRGLISFHYNAGDAEQWRSGLPCDAHLLLHVLRTSVPGLYPYVRLGHQGALGSAEPLTLFIGDVGEPYFYVRHFHEGRDRLYVTHPGPSTLFEALLVLAAVIHLYYADCYGGVRGTVDLEETGLLYVLTGRSTPQPGRPASRQSRLSL